MAPPQSEPVVVGGRYRLEGLLDRGSMGSVYRARHLVTGNLVALKRIRATHEQHELIMARFRREVGVSAAVPHDGIVKVYDAGEEEDGTLYLAMELLHGETLRARSQSEGFTVGYGINCVRALLEPLSAVHAAGIVHRDIKPDNIFLHRRPDGRDQVKLLDFGIAKDPRHQTSTRTDVGLGTPYYMAPEQATSAASVTSAADVWAVGIILYWMLARRLPFTGETPFNTLTLVCTAPHAPIRVEGASASTDQLIALIDRCLSKEPEDRPADASALLAALNVIFGPRSSHDSLSTISYGSNPSFSAPLSPPLPVFETAEGVLPPMPDAAPLPPRSPWRRRALVVAAVVSLAAGVAVLGRSGPAPAERVAPAVERVEPPRPAPRADVAASEGEAAKTSVSVSARAAEEAMAPAASSPPVVRKPAALKPKAPKPAAPKPKAPPATAPKAASAKAVRRAVGAPSAPEPATRSALAKPTRPTPSRSTPSGATEAPSSQPKRAKARPSEPAAPSPGAPAVELEAPSAPSAPSRAKKPPPPPAPPPSKPKKPRFLTF